ncbi:MAG TPA: DUF1269 domain-containing protein [Sphingomonas sp.]
MTTNNVVVAIYTDHAAADAAIKKLAAADFSLENLSVVGKGFHTDEHVVGFYNSGDRIKFWGTRGAFWGGLWGLFLGGLFITAPATGPVILLGYLAAAAITAVESAVVVGGLSALGAALVGLGIPKDSVLEYENQVKADGFLVMVHGDPEEIARAKALLATTPHTHIAEHHALIPVVTAG